MVVWLTNSFGDYLNFPENHQSDELYVAVHWNEIGTNSNPIKTNIGVEDRTPIPHTIHIDSRQEGLCGHAT